MHKRLNVKIFFAVLLFSFCPYFSYGQPLVGSADRLTLLQKIQGGWRGQCERAQSKNKNAYKKVDIRVSYTHFEFQVVEYEGMDCVKERARFSQRYAYAVGPGFVTNSGKTAYPIDFKKADTKPLLYNIPLHDLIYYKSGQLYFGRSYALKDGQRPSSIDFQTKYVR